MEKLLVLLAIIQFSLLVTGLIKQNSFGKNLKYNSNSFKLFSDINSIDVSDVEIDNDNVAINNINDNPSLKDNLMSSDFTDRSYVNSLILQLEQLSNLNSKSFSPKSLDGKWEFLYSGSLTDPGLVIYQVAKISPFKNQISLDDLEISIEKEGSQAISSCNVKISDQNVKFSIESKLSFYDISRRRFKEEYSSGKVGSVDISFPKFLTSRYLHFFIFYIQKSLNIIYYIIKNIGFLKFHQRYDCDIFR